MATQAAIRGISLTRIPDTELSTADCTRKSNTTDDSILALLDQINENAKQENSNKNPTINSTQRDYMAGEVSKDLTMRVLLPEEIVKAHDEGIIHFHDSDLPGKPESTLLYQR